MYWPLGGANRLLNATGLTMNNVTELLLIKRRWKRPQGRNADEQVKMIQQVATFNSSLPQRRRITVSVEIEKTREPLYQLFPHGDVVRLQRLSAVLHLEQDPYVDFLFHAARPGVRQ